jgi:hypothetical protein
MKKILATTFTLILLALSTTAVYGQTPPATGYPIANYETYTLGGGNTYYLDAVNGNDNNNGTTNPWQTLAKAQSVVTSGDNVILRSGNYGAFTENNAGGRTTWVTYRADTYPG